jgi:hypothetical protein
LERNKKEKENYDQVISIRYHFYCWCDREILTFSHRLDFDLEIGEMRNVEKALSMFINIDKKKFTHRPYDQVDDPCSFRNRDTGIAQ